MDQYDYISLRIINACLREDVSGLITKGTITEDGDQNWLIYQGLNCRLRIAVRASDYMQPWVAIQPCWQIDNDGEWVESVKVV